MNGTDELRLPQSTERPEPRSRLIALAAVIVGLGLCTGIAAIGLRMSDPVAAASPTDQAAPGAPTAAAPGAAGATADAPPPRLSATGALALIADDITLSGENDKGWSGANYEVTVCPGPKPQYQGLRTVNDLRVLHTLADNPRRQRVLAIAASEGEASGLLSELSQPFISCRVGGEEAGTRFSEEITGDQWQEGRILAISVEEPDGTPDVNGYLVVARAGRAVVAQSITGSALPRTDGTRMDESLSEELQGFLDAMSDRVCRYREGGCYTPPPPIYQAPPGSVLLPDGTFQLPDGSVVDAQGTLLRPAPAPVPPPEQPGDPTPESAPEQPRPAPAPTGQTPEPRPSGQSRPMG